MTRKLRCSFCGRSEDQVRRLIAGPRVFICDGCVAACDAILARHPPPPPPGAADEAADPAAAAPRAQWWWRVRPWRRMACRTA